VPSLQEKQETVKIELNKDQWNDIQAVLNAMKKYYVVLDQ
jgi:RNA:NAD 2'-phosphotransferase (TPT1/KptA family)